MARVAIRNGTLIQGAGKSADSSAILFRGGTDGHNELDHLVIRVHGPYTTAIHAGFDTYAFNESRIHHNYIETHDATCTAGCGGPQGINVMAQERGGVEVYDNIVVGAHRGIALAYVGTAVGSLPSQVYRNRVQQARVIDCKAPYGIALFAQTHHVSVHHNEIVSDDGRGIILDGWSQSGGAASGNLVTDNRVDVQYSSAATIGGCYRTQSYGIERYESGENTIQGNTVLVTSGNGSPVWGWYVGSDTADPFMHDIAIRQNVTIVRRVRHRQAGAPHQMGCRRVGRLRRQPLPYGRRRRPHRAGGQPDVYQQHAVDDPAPSALASPSGSRSRCLNPTSSPGTRIPSQTCSVRRLP